MLDDSKTLALIRDFIRMPKHEGTGPLDVLQVVSLLAFKAIDHDANFSQSTLANYFGCSKNTIVRSQKHLGKLGWLTSQAKGKNSTKAQAVSVESLPLSTEAKISVTPEAKEISVRYKLFLQNKCGRKRFPTGWLEKQFYNAQRILNEFEGNAETVRKLIGFAATDPRFAKASRKSLYHIVGLRRRWNAIRQAFDAQGRTGND